MISDVRASDQAARIQADPAFAALGLPGGRVTPDLMLPKIVWLREREPAHHARTCWFATSNDFLVHRLTGEMATDPTNATKYLYGETDGTGYPAGLLSALDVDVATLPPVVHGGSAVLALRPELRERFGLHPDIRVVLSTYDAICAVYGSGWPRSARRATSLLGHGHELSRRHRPERPRPGRAPVHDRPHRAGPLPRGQQNNLGGGVIEWAKQVLYPDDPAPYETMVAEAIDAPPGAAGLTFLPYLLGERAPVWDSNARAVFFGLGRNHSRADMIRAVFEGVGYSVLDIADRLGGMGVEVHRVSASAASPGSTRSTRSSRTCSASRSP